MMLETIKSYIQASANDVPFNQFYIEYVMRVQDENIERELYTMLHKNVDIDVMMMDRLINSTFEGLKDIL